MWKLQRVLPARSTRRTTSLVTPGSPVQGGPGQEAAVTNDTDFITVDDGGTFTYYPSSAALCGDFEYAGQTESIIDRGANHYPLILDKSRHVALGRSLGKADMLWLRTAWREVQEAAPQLYPLNRELAVADPAFLSGLRNPGTDRRLSAGRPSLDSKPAWAGQQP
ncbi:hypothetical protein [Arthrobacter sp. H14-L1]|uniref:hypothetical protein n=1 Tax=Arthrobacter sp. H14-L1 TaxID=2996697 RepID=UPI00226D935D|nr:hypothetical protein [Arthrobacter sp. H14-L1]MCY0904628.1 hypothetical protein [Arthrobacter sp. H14-L1]